MKRRPPARLGQAARALDRDDLIASHYTLCGAWIGAPSRSSFVERVAAASAAGFTGIGLLVHDYQRWREGGLGDAEMRSVLDDHGVCVAELEFLLDWCHDGARARESRALEDGLYAVADALGARHMNVGDIGPASELPAVEIVAERFAELCERARAHGLLVALEFLPWTGIPDAGTAWRIARHAGANGGLLIDSWHYFRGTADPEQLRAIPGERIVGVQLDDAAAEPHGSLREETLHRLLPGRGALDLIGLVRLLDEMGFTGPMSVEIISPEHAKLAIGEAARCAHDAARGVVTRARRR